MKIILKHDIYPVKNGIAAHSPEIGLTAHGYSAEIAKLNLKRIAVMFLKPFERQGELENVIERLNLKTEKDGTEVTVEVT